MQVVRYHSDIGNHIVLVAKTGRKFISIIPMDSSGIRVRKVPLSEERYFKELDYPVKKAKKIFRQAAKNFGVTKTARQLLKG